MSDMIAWLANHFFYCSLKKNSDEMVELAKNISRKTPDEISEFISNLGGIISGHNEFSEGLHPDLEALNKKFTIDMKDFSNSEMEDLK